MHATGGAKPIWYARDGRGASAEGGDSQVAADSIEMPRKRREFLRGKFDAGTFSMEERTRNFLRNGRWEESRSGGEQDRSEQDDQDQSADRDVHPIAFQRERGD